MDKANNGETLKNEREYTGVSHQCITFLNTLVSIIGVPLSLNTLVSVIGVPPFLFY